MTNRLPSEVAPLMATIDPDAYAADTYVSDYVDMRNFHAAMAVVQAGTLGTSATLDAKLVQATDSSGTGAKDISGKAITQIVKATGDDTQAVINLRAEELDVDGGFTHVAISMTVGTATSDASAYMHGVFPRHEPAADLASVAEIV